MIGKVFTIQHVMYVTQEKSLLTGLVPGSVLIRLLMLSMLDLIWKCQALQDGADLFYLTLC